MLLVYKAGGGIYTPIWGPLACYGMNRCDITLNSMGALTYTAILVDLSIGWAVNYKGGGYGGPRGV